MSKRVNIVVKKLDVYTEVLKTSAYIGKKRAANNDELFERIAAEEENAELFDRKWDEGMVQVGSVLHHYLVSGDFEDNDGVNAELDMPDNWDCTLHNTMVKSIVTYLHAFITAEWLRVLGLSDDKDYGADAQAALYEMMRVLYRRRRPVRMATKPPLSGCCHADNETNNTTEK